MVTLPDISVVMSVYNGEKYLKEAIDSILNQTFTDFEFIIINDGSVDNSRNIIQSYHDTRIRLIENEKNIGLTKSLNKGILLSKGKYVARMDADDISLPERFQLQFDFMEKNPEIGVCGTNCRILGTSEKKTLPADNEKIKFLLFSGINPLVHPSVIIRKKTLLDNKILYNETIRYAQDFELWSRGLSSFSFSNVQDYLLIYRNHSEQITNKKTYAQKEVVKNCVLGHLTILGIKPDDDIISKHLTLINTSVLDTQAKLKSVIAWSDTLIDLNQQAKIIQHDTFRKEIHLKVRYLIMKHLQTNKKIIFNISIIKYLSPAQILKMYLVPN